jgi:glycosyltransferase involved in cell wall biosynthesis
MISVIIPTYNRSQFLAEAVESVLAQSVFQSRKYSFEIIIIDDGSTDDTRKVVEKFSGPINYYYQPHQGVSRARNHGLEKAKGEFIAFLDSDDLWLPEKIKLQMNVMENLPHLMGCTTEEIWLRRGKRVNPREKHRKYSGWIFPHALPLCILSLSASLFRRQVFEEIGTFDESLPACEDYDFSLRYSLRYPLHLIDRPLIIKRGGHHDQLSRQFWGLDRFRLQALLKLLALNLTQEQAFLVRQEILKKARIVRDGALKRGKLEEARYYQQIIDRIEKEINSP